MKRSSTLTWDQLRVGLVILLAVAVIGVAIYKLGEAANLFAKRYELIAYLPDANGLKRGDWGKLPKKLAEQLTKGSQEEIPGEYRQAVETYSRVIAEKTKKRP